VRARFHVAVTTLPVLLCLAPPGHAQTLTLTPPLAENVEALPRMIGKTEVADKVNSALEKLDEGKLNYLTCDGENPDYAFRSVDVLSEGPAFLSILVNEGGRCGDLVQPWSIKETLNFDLASGDQIGSEWFLPDAWTTNHWDAQNNRSAMALSPRWLFDVYLEALAEAPPSDDCLDTLVAVYDLEQLNLILGVDSERRSLVVLPEKMPLIANDCELTALIGVETLKMKRFEYRVIERLEATP
jgi:hypothetical protein